MKSCEMKAIQHRVHMEKLRQYCPVCGTHTSFRPVANLCGDCKGWAKRMWIKLVKRDPWVTSCNSLLRAMGGTYNA